MAKGCPSRMGLLATELGCCCWVFVSCKAPFPRTEMLYVNHGSDIVRTWTLAVNRPEVKSGARRSSDGFLAGVSCCSMRIQTKFPQVKVCLLGLLNRPLHSSQFELCLYFTAWGSATCAVPVQRRNYWYSALLVLHSEISCSQQNFSSCGERWSDGQICVQYHSISIAFFRREKGRPEKLNEDNWTRIFWFDFEWGLVHGSENCGCWSLWQKAKPWHRLEKGD